MRSADIVYCHLDSFSTLRLGHSMKRSSALKEVIGAKYWPKVPHYLPDLCNMSLSDFVARGIPLTEARRIRASIDLAKEVCEPSMGYGSLRLTSPATAMQYCLSEFRALACHGVQEEFWIVTLDTKNQVKNKHRVTVGTLRNSLVHPREVFRPAIHDAAHSIVAVHNHPSGDPTPSDQDISVTERLEQAAEIIGIPLIDHIVVAGDRAISITEWRSGNRW
jgi:DNA repair protein RadC